MVLEIDALAEAVSSNQDTARAVAQGFTRASRSDGGMRPVTRLDRHPEPIGQPVAKLLCDVLRSLDEPAEHDGVEAVVDQPLHQCHRVYELLIVFSVQRVCPRGKLSQLASDRIVTGSLRVTSRDDIDALLGLVEIENGLTPDHIGFLGGSGLCGRGACAHGRSCSGRAGGQRPQQTER